MKGIGGHQSAKMISDEWLTPPEIIKALGEFDLDPCSPICRPWDTAKNHYTILDNGLTKKWVGRVWMNPVYGRQCIKWLSKLADHGNGISIIFARTETEMFFKQVWDRADSIFFFQGRLHFHTVNGKRAKSNAGGPSCLISYGEKNVQSISDSGLRGKHIYLKSIPMLIVGVSPSWKSVVSIAIKRIDREACLNEIYEMVELIAPDKVNNSSFFREKIRQTLQRYFKKIDKGVWAIEN